MPDAPPWLGELLVCPEDGHDLVRRERGYHCQACGRLYPVHDGIVTLLPSRLDDLDGGSGDRADEVEWVAGEKQWWDQWVQTDSREPYDGRRGLRGRSRERNLFRPVRDATADRPATLVEMGAGSSRTVGGLWPPGADLRYVATDLSRAWLQSGEALRGPTAAAVQCDAGAWPIRPASADVVAILGVLHHLPDWRRSLAHAMATVRPGGHLILHEVIEKPRILASRRSSGLCDSWTSPHEGSVEGNDLRAELEREGEIVRWRGESTPLRFFLMYYAHLHDRLEASSALTTALDLADQAFGRTAGRIVPSLGFGEVTCVWRRRT